MNSNDLHFKEQFVRMYPDTKNANIAATFGLSVRTVVRLAHEYGVKKSDDFRKSLLGGRFVKGERRFPNTEFKKSQIPWNKGKRMDRRTEAYNRLVARSFKKGNLPHNTKSDGYISVRNIKLRNGERRPYKFIRLSLGRWEFLHIHLWRKAGRDIPSGQKVIFKDGNPMNCVLENLELVSGAELLDRSRFTRYPVELQQLIRTKNRFNREIQQRL